MHKKDKHIFYLLLLYFLLCLAFQDESSSHLDSVATAEDERLNGIPGSSSPPVGQQHTLPKKKRHRVPKLERERDPQVGKVYQIKPPEEFLTAFVLFRHNGGGCEGAPVSGCSGQ